MPRIPRLAKITLNPTELALLHAPWSGSEGFQKHLAPNIQAIVTPAGDLAFDDGEHGEIVRYMSYVQSGSRDRVHKVFRRSVINLMKRKQRPLLRVPLSFGPSVRPKIADNRVCQAPRL